MHFAVIPVWVAYDSSQHSFCAQIQAKEADIHALSELTRALSDIQEIGHVHDINLLHAS